MEFDEFVQPLQQELELIRRQKQEKKLRKSSGAVEVGEEAGDEGEDSNGEGVDQSSEGIALGKRPLSDEESSSKALRVFEAESAGNISRLEQQQQQDSMDESTDTDTFSNRLDPMDQDDAY